MLKKRKCTEYLIVNNYQPTEIIKKGIYFRSTCFFLWESISNKISNQSKNEELKVALEEPFLFLQVIGAHCGNSLRVHQHHALFLSLLLLWQNQDLEPVESIRQ